MNFIHNPKQSRQTSQIRCEHRKLNMYAYIGRDGIGPENFLNERTSDGLVSITVPNFPNTLIRPWTWSRHPHYFLSHRKEKSFVLLEEKQTPNSLYQKLRELPLLWLLFIYFILHFFLTSAECFRDSEQNAITPSF